MSKLRLGIDASNLRESGGLTHLTELLRAAEPPAYGINQVVVWSGDKTLSCLPKRKWLILKTDPLLNQPLLARIYWQKYQLSKAVEQNCDVLFVPGGYYLGSFHPFVTMSQNVLPFEPMEYRRYGISWMTLKMALLQFIQNASFRSANGLIFLNEYSRKVVMKRVKTLVGECAIIPHGANKVFLLSPRPAKQLTNYSRSSPFRLLYVSNVLPYKHQWYVAKAVHELKQTGFWVELDLVGSSYLPSLTRLRNVMQQVDPDGEYIHYHGVIPYSELTQYYQRADGFVFASSCESFSITLLEAMAAGLPIACSNRGPMPGLLGEAGIYFNPEKTESIVAALTRLIQDNSLREQLAQTAYTRAQDYSWERCAEETMGFIAKTARRYLEISKS